MSIVKFSFVLSDPFSMISQLHSGGSNQIASTTATLSIAHCLFVLTDILYMYYHLNLGGVTKCPGYSAQVHCKVQFVLTDLVSHHVCWLRCDRL